MNKYKYIKLPVIIILFSANAHSQGNFRGSNLLEYQLGNIPGLKPEYQSSLYDQLNLSYNYKSITLQTRIEQYYPSFDDNKGYTSISQYRAKFKTQELSVTIGNIYPSFGKGLLLRTYEIPGSIWEDRGYRIRYGFYKDLEGAEIRYQLGKFKIKGVYGKVLDVTLPPTLSKDERRPDLVQGAELKFQHKKLALGSIFMNHKIAGNSENYVSVFTKSRITKSLSLYTEFAVKAGSDAELKFDNDSSYGFYLSLNYVWKNLGVSLELKDYKNFSIGSGISDPPTLIKEHSYKLLNRSTHVPILSNERGYQLEVYYRLPNNNLITFNHSIAHDEISETQSHLFNEFFTEYQTQIGGQIFANFFLNYSSDPFTNEDNRYSGGFIFDIGHNKASSIIESQIQFVERKVIETDKFYNFYFSYQFNIRNKLSTSALLEISKDPFLLNENEEYAFYPGGTLSYRPNNKHHVILFYGKRRGGPACNSGVCYDVLDFQGLEIRILSHI